jgi:CubicO group peptidase (beta-lactamase class C family)
MKIIENTCLLMLSVLFYSCLNESDLKLEYKGFQPVQQSDGWVLSSPENENMESSFLDKAYNLVYDDSRFIMARSLLVIRNGKLVAEAYPHNINDQNQIQNLQSCTKSFTSILTGIALSKGILDSVSQKFSEIIPNYFTAYPDKADITIEDALMMRTGIDFNDNDHTLDFYQTSGSSVEFVLNLPKKYPPGIVYHYNDGAPQLISAAIQEKCGKSLSLFAEEFIFNPLQIKDWKWESAKDGLTFGAFSLYLKPRDAAKFGQLLLNNGKWNGQQLVDSNWISKATQPLVNSSSDGASYGYYFRVYPAYPAYSALGHGGQYIFVVPSRNLVIVYTAWPYTSGEMFDNFAEIADLVVHSCN